MTKIDFLESLIHDIQDKVYDAMSLPQRAHSHPVLVAQDDKLLYADPKQKYHISTSERYPLDIGYFIWEHNTDLALKSQVVLGHTILTNKATKQTDKAVEGRWLNEIDRLLNQWKS